MTFRKVKGNFERLFDKNQSDLVRGIRNNKDNEHKYINQCIEEIKEELKQENLNVKANAIAKLNYLQMLGYDISWAAFNVIEVMSSVKFTHKRVGYLCASQCFHENMDVMMLTTNMIKKDLHSQSMYDAGLALSGLACFVNSDIARDLANDVLMQLNSTKPYLRKKAVLTLYKIFLKYPEALKIAFPRLKEKLEDPDPGVQSAAVNVICELARKNPKNYLCLAPIFFKLMQNSSNNWMLIKIIKLFGALTSLEHRLGKKLIEPLTNLINSTSAMSLLYECINTVIAVLISISSGLPNHNSSIQLCVQKLRILIEDTDQNLKYLGLLAMAKILKTHPKSVQTHKDMVLACLEDKDESIRLRALDLIIGMISKKNLIEIIHKLMQNIQNSNLGNKYRDELIFKIIEICSQNDYAFISNFEWYISVLVDLSRVEGGTIHSNLIARQIFDVTTRVESITEFSTHQMSIMLENAEIFTDFCDVLYAAAFICGEFSNYLEDKKKTCLSLLKNYDFPHNIQATFLQNALKIFVKLIENEQVNDLYQLCDKINTLLKPFLFSDDFEVQERATTFQQILIILQDKSIYDVSKINKNLNKKEIQNHNNNNNENKIIENQNIKENNDNEFKESEINQEIHSHKPSNLIESTEDDSSQFLRLEPIFFAYPIKPVAAKAQKKVPIPLNLNLDVPFKELQDSEEEDIFDDDQSNDEISDAMFSKHSFGNESKRKKLKKHKNKTKKSKKEKKEENKNPMYLKNYKDLELTSKINKETNYQLDAAIDVIALEAVEATEEQMKDVKFTIPGLVSSDKYFQEFKTNAKSKSSNKIKKGKKVLRNVDLELDNENEENQNKIKILSLEMPDNFESNNELEEQEEIDLNDPHRALANVTFDEFLIQEKTLKSVKDLSINENFHNKPKKKEKKLNEKKKKTNKDKYLSGENEENYSKRKKIKKKNKEKSDKEDKLSKKTKKVLEVNNVKNKTNLNDRTRNKDDYEQNLDTNNVYEQVSNEASKLI